MDSLYDAKEAQRFIDHYAPAHGEDLALRIYTSRLLGQNPALVLHGGGNTSVKSTVNDLLGDPTEVLFVKGSGWDLGAIEPRGFPACRLAPLRRGVLRPTMSDEEMVALLRSQMLDPSSPTPSVEALLHAALPAKFVDHTHADAVLAVVDQPDSAELVREVWGGRALFVPYVMPGFGLARHVAELIHGRLSEGGPTLMVLDKHGFFSWGESAEESYTRMIEGVTAAEDFLRRKLVARPPAVAATRTEASAAADEALRHRIAPLVRGQLERVSGHPWVARWRATPGLVAFSERPDAGTISQVGCVTPDHVIRTKARPLALLEPLPEGATELRQALDASIADYASDYHDGFVRASTARKVSPKALDPWPRVILVKGLGALTLGKTRGEADVVGDVYEHTADVISNAADLGAYTPVSELDLFDVEYWSLEQAKLGKGGASGGVVGRIALVTGAASGIGLGTSEALLAGGAHVVLSDRDGEALAAVGGELAKRYAGRVTWIACDVTSEGEARGAVAEAVRTFGGLDIVISNAGTAPSGLLHTSEGDVALRGSLAVNLLGHQNVARAATEVFLAQGTGGALLFNASKSAFNQGPEFGPYAVAKAALVALMRQYAVDLAPYGVRANAVNADRIRTSLFGGGVLEARAKARGVAVDAYFQTNLLGRETAVGDVARAFVYLATAAATTGCVITVDGGNAAAFPR